MHYFKFVGSKESAQELWENREALNKYMVRLLELDAEARQVIIVNNLYYKMCGFSLGEILKSELERRKMSICKLSQRCDISADTLEAMASDSIYPNCIPVLLLWALFRILDIKEDVARMAIINTFEILDEKKKAKK